MEEQDVRDRAEALCAALVVGDVERVTADLSRELRQNLGEVLAPLPLPATDATMESVDRGGGGGYSTVLRLVGDTDEVMIQTRWKQRDGRPTIIEASHLSRTAPAASGVADGGAEAEGDGEETV